MARKLFSPIAKGRGVSTLHKADPGISNADLKRELKTKIALLNEILTYGYDSAIEDESGENRIFMTRYKASNNKELIAAIKAFEQQLFQL